MMKVDKLMVDFFLVFLTVLKYIVKKQPAL